MCVYVFVQEWHKVKVYCMACGDEIKPFRRVLRRVAYFKCNGCALECPHCSECICNKHWHCDFCGTWNKRG